MVEVKYIIKLIRPICQKIQKIQTKLDRAQPTHPPPYPNCFYFWKPISETARTLKSQWLLTTFNIQTEDITLRSYHMITQSPHWK